MEVTTKEEKSQRRNLSPYFKPPRKKKMIMRGKYSTHRARGANPPMEPGEQLL
jgi:hypothetical protein